MDSNIDKVAAEVGVVLGGAIGWIVGRHLLGLGGGFALLMIFAIAGWAIGNAAKSMGLLIPLVLVGVLSVALLFHAYGLAPQAMPGTP